MKLFFNTTMVQKICMISLVCLTVPSLIFSFYLYRRQAREVYSQLAQEQLTAIEQAAQSTDSTLQSISRLEQDIAYSESLINYLSRMHRVYPDLDKYPVWSAHLLNYVISTIKYSLKFHNLGVQAANIFVPHSLPVEGNYFWRAERLCDLEFFQDFKDSGDFHRLYYLNQEETKSFRSVCGYPSGSAGAEIILLICRIDRDYSEECMGYILFECSPSKVFSSILTPHAQEKDYYVWFHSSRNGYGVPPSIAPAELLAQAPQGAFAFYVDKGRQRFVCCTLENYDITVINTCPLPAGTYVKPALRLSLILAALALLQLVILTLFIRKSFDHLHRDLNLMDAIIAHGFKEKIPVNRNDEIGMIARRYNILLDKVSSLIQENVERQTAWTKARLEALQYQINPHFIYNTLNIFSGYAAQHDQNALAESIASFGQLLRYHIKDDGLETTVEEELRSAASLISVYNIRYFNQLHLSTNVPGELMQFRIIKFLLQPILENSILHGLVLPDTSLHIHILMQKSGDFVEIGISDDGEGMSPGRLAEVDHYMRNPTADRAPASTRGTFIGLENIYRRLKLFYGQQAGLSIESTQHQGTRITVRIPASGIRKQGGFA